MSSSMNHKNLDASNGFYYKPAQDLMVHCYPQDSQGLDLHPSFDDSTQINSLPVQSSPSTISFSPNGSPISQLDSQSNPSDSRHSPDNTYGSHISVSSVTDDVDDLRNTLREWESMMLEPDSDMADSYGSTIHDDKNQASVEHQKLKDMTEAIQRGDLKQALVACAKAISDNDMPTTEWLIAELRQMVSVCGDPVQRLGAYMLEGLVARLASSGSSIYKALRCKEPASAELLSHMHSLYEACPYFKFGYMSANGAIADALKDENRIHIIDFQISQGTQWLSLIKALASRTGGPPTYTHHWNGGLQLVGQRLSHFARMCNVPFEFHAGAMFGSNAELENLTLTPGEALAVNFPLMLHHMPDESVSTHNHRDRLLRLVKSLSPKVVTLVEQEANTNTAPFVQRFIETLNYYTAIFESIDVKLPREDKERINVEQHCLARDVVNIIACEGVERVERHELLGKWKSRFMMAGFTPYPLSPVFNATIKAVLENYNEKYTLEEKDGALYLGWKNKALVASCAWQ
ncbi:hypothetical protein MKW92_019159 [Papaver armeniacum]|nr:hypothetical protein MKW92_019159 [Papaver armeniacum]